MTCWSWPAATALAPPATVARESSAPGLPVFAAASAWSALTPSSSRSSWSWWGAGPWLCNWMVVRPAESVDGPMNMLSMVVTART